MSRWKSGTVYDRRINRQLKRTLASAFVDTLGEAEYPVMKLAAQYMDLGEAMRERMSHVFEERYGIALTEFVVERVSLPDEVTQFLRKRQGMALVGVSDYTQFQAANAIEQAATNPGGGNAMLDAGMGLAMGGVIGSQMMGSMGQPGMDGVRHRRWPQRLHHHLRNRLLRCTITVTIWSGAISSRADCRFDGGRPWGNPSCLGARMGARLEDVE